MLSSIDFFFINTVVTQSFHVIQNIIVIVYLLASVQVLKIHISSEMSSMSHVVLEQTIIFFASYNCVISSC